MNLTLTVATVAVLDRMTAVTGAGRASFLREMIEESAPHFAQMADALEKARDNKADAFKIMADAVGDAVAQGEQLHLDIKRTRRRAMRRKKDA